MLECGEEGVLALPEGAELPRRAWYGDPQRRWEVGKGCGVDCTDVVARRLQANGGWVLATNVSLGSDPVPGVRKCLLVELATAVPFTIGAFSYPRPFKSVDAVPSASGPSGPRWLAFVRHAEAGHNVDKELLNCPDNALTGRGREQAVAARAELAEMLRAADVIITTPLLRALQTTALLLGPGCGEDPRVVVDAAATERLSAPCDMGTCKSELLEIAPQECRRWRGWEALPERWWPDADDDTWGRREAFVAALRERPEARIVCVGHGAFWQLTLGRYLGNCTVAYCDRSLT